MNKQDNYSAIAHNLFNQQIPIKVYKRRHDKQDHELQIHSHDFMELVIVTDGTAIHSVYLNENEHYSYRIKKGSCFLMNMYEKHTYEFEENEFISLLNVLFDPSLLNKLKHVEDTDPVMEYIYLFPNLPPDDRFNNPPLDISDLSDIIFLVDKLNVECESSNTGHSAIQVLLLWLILAYLLRQFPCNDKIRQNHYKSVNILRTIGYIQQHFSENLTLDELSDLAMCGKRHLTRQFKSITGETISEYICRLRVMKARSLLQNTDMKITDIATSVGYNDPSFFNRRFREITGCTPTEFRNEIALMSNANSL